MTVRRDTTRRLGRGILIGCGLLLWAGTTASAAPQDASVHGKYRGECRKLTRQIDHYDNTVLPMALARGNRAWEQATNEQIERLWNRRADLCPKYGAQRTLLHKIADQVHQFNKFMVSAAHAAAAYFSGGLTGGIAP